MDAKDVFHKTEKGAQEIATRANRLPARMRSVLILVDGKSTAEQIVHQAQHFGDAAQFLSELLNNGFIERLVVRTEAELLPAQGELDTTSPAAPTVSLASAKEFASHFLLDEIGPDADIMASRIDGCTTVAQLLPLLEKYRDVLRATRGARKAELFWQGTANRLPAL